MKYAFMRLACWFVRRFYDVPGVWRLQEPVSKAAARVFTHRSFPARAALKCGYRMNVDLQDFGGRFLYIHGYYEAGTTLVFEHLLRPGDSVVDIGGNLGYFSLLAASRIGREGSVTTFEASPRIFQYLEANRRLNGVDTIRCQNVAVGATAGQIDFFEGPSDHLGISTVRDLGNGAARRLSVPMTTIDSMLATIPPVRLVKMDIEGAEHSALRGMERLLARDRPFVVMELTDSFLRELGSSAQEVCEFFSARDYTIYVVEYDGIRPLDRIPTEQANVLAVGRGAEIPPELLCRTRQ